MCRKLIRTPSPEEVKKTNKGVKDVRFGLIIPANGWSCPEGPAAHSYQSQVRVLMCKDVNPFLTQFFRIQQKFNAPGLGDVEAATRLALGELPVAKLLVDSKR